MGFNSAFKGLITRISFQPVYRRFPTSLQGKLFSKDYVRRYLSVSDDLSIAYETTICQKSCYKTNSPRTAAPHKPPFAQLAKTFSAFYGLRFVIVRTTHRPMTLSQSTSLATV